MLGTSTSVRGTHTLTTLTIEAMCREAQAYSQVITNSLHPALHGVTDGKAVGTYVEQNFINHLLAQGYVFQQGNAANGLDFPGLEVDIKVTSIAQPQSSCPFRSLGQKIFGLGYGIIIFVYEKEDTPQGARLVIRDNVFIDKKRTADFTMTTGLNALLDQGANQEDLAAFLAERNLTADYNELMRLAQEVLQQRPSVGYLTISPALQWRLQYSRALRHAGEIEGLTALYKVNN